MCGRFRLTQKKAAVEGALRADWEERPIDIQWPLKLRYNVAPTDLMPVLSVVDGKRSLRSMRWGLVPFWKKAGEGPALINARIETLEEKPMFRQLLERQRCLVPADGFYEWKREGSTKTPLLFTVGDGELFTFAGLWTRAKVEGVIVDSFTIITTTPNEVVKPVHDRMPLIVEENARDAWLDGVDLRAFEEPKTLPGFRARVVSSKVGSVKNDDESVLVPDEEKQPKETAKKKKSQQQTLF